MVLTAGTEEVTEEDGALPGKDAGNDFGAWMERRIKCLHGITALWVGSTVNDAPYLRPGYGPGTHQAWLHSDIQGAVCQVFSTKSLGGCGYSLHLGVGRDIAETFGEVVPPSYNRAVAYYNGAYGYFPGFAGTP